jgi:hypothetical protein
MIPASQIQSVPTSAMTRPRPIPIISVDRTAITASRIAAPAMAP